MMLSNEAVKVRGHLSCSKDVLTGKPGGKLMHDFWREVHLGHEEGDSLIRVIQRQTELPEDRIKGRNGIDKQDGSTPGRQLRVLQEEADGMSRLLCASAWEPSELRRKKITLGIGLKFAACRRPETLSERRGDQDTARMAADGVCACTLVDVQHHTALGLDGLEQTRGSLYRQGREDLGKKRRVHLVDVEGNKVLANGLKVFGEANGFLQIKDRKDKPDVHVRELQELRELPLGRLLKELARRDALGILDFGEVAKPLPTLLLCVNDQDAIVVFENGSWPGKGFGTPPGRPTKRFDGLPLLSLG
jgi:hypothetical protein